MKTFYTLPAAGVVLIATSLAAYAQVSESLQLSSETAKESEKAQPQSKQIAVIGIGANPESAEKQAITDAVRQAVGAYVDADTIVQNEQVIKDRILSVSNGFVKEYKVATTAKQREDGLYEVQILASVEIAQVLSILKQSNLVSATMAGSDIWAEATTKASNAENSLEFLREKMPEFCRSIIKSAFLDKSGAPAKTSNPAMQSQDSRKLRATWFVSLSVDREAYFATFAPALVRCLRNITGATGSKFQLQSPKHRDFFKGNPGGASEYFGREVPFKIPFLVFTDEILGPDKRVIYDKTMFIVEKATKNSDYLEGTMFRVGEYQYVVGMKSSTPWLISVELLDEGGALIAKGSTPIREPFSVRASQNYDLPKGALSQVGPFLYTEAYGYDVICVDPVYPVEVEVPLESMKEVKKIECKLEMPADFDFFTEQAGDF